MELQETTNTPARPPLRPAVSVKLVPLERCSYLWVFLLQLLIVATAVVAFSYFLGEDEHKLTMVYMTTTLTPFMLLAMGSIVSLCPKDTWVRLSSFILCELIFLCRSFIYFGMKNYPGAIGNLMFFGVYYLIYRAMEKLAACLPAKLNNDNESLNKFNCQTIPLTTTGSLMSMLYCASESFSCLLDEENHNDVENCADKINSNEGMLWFLTLSAFAKLYIIPHLEVQYSVADLLRFDLKNSREAVLVLLTAVVGLYTIFVYASSEKLHENFDHRTNTTTTKVVIMDGNETALRNTITKIVPFMIGLVPLVLNLSKNMIPRFRVMTRTTLRARIAPIYRWILELVALTITSLNVYYVFLVYTSTNIEQEVNKIEKWRILCWATNPLIWVVVTLHFFGTPTAQKRKENVMFFLFSMFFVLQTLGNFFQAKIDTERGETRLNSVFVNGFLALMVIPIYLMVNSSRKMLAKHHIDDIDAHLQRCLSLAISIVPPIIFLFAEPQSCVAYANNYKIEQCALLRESNYVVGGHLSYAFLFYVTFGYKLDSMTKGGLLSLQDMRFHTVCQLICLIISSTTCFIVYGMRNSELYAERVFNDESIGKLDEFLTSSSPFSMVADCWAVTLFTQLLHSRRMETEAKFHRRSVDDQKHSKMIHRFTSWVDQRTKKIIEKFHVNDDEARVATPIRVILFLMSISSGVLSLFVVCFSSQLGIQQIYRISHGMGSLRVFSVVSTFIFLFTHLSDTLVADKVIFLSMVVVFGADSYFEYKRRSAWEANIVFGVLASIAMLGILKLKKTTMKVCSFKVRREHCHSVMVAGISQLIPVIFLTSEHWGCLTRFSEDVTENFVKDENCRSVEYGVNAIQMQLAFAFGVYATSSTLMRGDEYSARNITTLNMPRRQLCEVSILGLAALLGILLFGIRQEGETPRASRVWQTICYYAIYLLWFFFFASVIFTSVTRDETNRMTDATLEEKISDLSGSTLHMFGKGKKTQFRSSSEAGALEGDDEKLGVGGTMSLNPGFM